MSAADLAKVSNVEKIKLVGDGAALTLAANVAGVTTIDLTDSDDQTLNLNSGLTNAVIVNLVQFYC